jgi:hypothetical protein
MIPGWASRSIVVIIFLYWSCGLDQWQALVNMVINHKRQAISWTAV